MDTQRTIGALTARVESQQAQLTQINSKVDTLLGYMQTSQGGISMLYKVGSIGGLLGGGLGTAVAHFFKHGSN